ncbi:hypothetical protein JCM3775_002320 [Rhodotorula graminis]|uniref:UDP-galactose transporter n=1 Tax=Rhodotorula graminis (strain WP1) TaxID=578459 RepID=A0A194S684_RHOGW|nr:uncharacterized protein RHOBADRAFT_53005 [Rhodotorula graminis WP1]KPV76005.1 hypothetical protein RHOBADRAFT_53005 [Rhodotorula graminis WP1]
MSATFLGVPLGLISLVTLTVQNSALTIVLHYSRISVPADRMYNAAAAVLLNELLKGAISLSIAYRNAVLAASSTRGGDYSRIPTDDEFEGRRRSGPGGGGGIDLARAKFAATKMLGEVFSSDCWKLSIPACLYVIQNNLQFVAASNLDVPTFQVTYNLKILTTALFSVILLRRRLSAKKWFALLFLAAGVGVVQLQSSAAAGSSSSSHGAHEMDKTKGLLAVFCACMTSGLAGVYFEMVLKGSKADLWIRNVQLSLFSLLPAVCAVFAPGLSLVGGPAKPNPTAGQPVFANFGAWAWAVVLIQVFGGLITALVIRYSDNIMKGFATSLAIVLSFCAGIILFDFRVTTSFLLGTSMVVAATYLYNLPDAPRRGPPESSLPTSLPSPSLASKGAFTPPLYSSHGRTDSNGSASSPATLHHPSAPFSHPAMRMGSTSSASTSASSATGAGAPHRRPNPQSVPPGAKTPDHRVVDGAFPLAAMRAASEDGGAGAGAGGHGQQDSAQQLPFMARTGTPDGGSEGFASGRMSAPGSPDPILRGRSPAPGSRRP